MKNLNLITVDYKQCQAEKPNGHTFMTLGGSPRPVRCKNVPTVIAKERKPGPEGHRGEMALCDECASVLLKQKGKGYAVFIPIKSKSASQPEVTTIAKDTPVVTWLLADMVVEEVRVILSKHSPETRFMSETLASHLGERADEVYQNNANWRRKFLKGPVDPRDYLLSYMRHWAAGWLVESKLLTLSEVPKDFANGKPIQYEKAKETEVAEASS